MLFGKFLGKCSPVYIGIGDMMGIHIPRKRHPASRSVAPSLGLRALTRAVDKYIHLLAQRSRQKQVGVGTCQHCSPPSSALGALCYRSPPRASVATLLWCSMRSSISGCAVLLLSWEVRPKWTNSSTPPYLWWSHFMMKYSTAFTS